MVRISEEWLAKNGVELSEVEMGFDVGRDLFGVVNMPDSAMYRMGRRMMDVATYFIVFVLCWCLDLLDNVCWVLGFRRVVWLL